MNLLNFFRPNQPWNPKSEEDWQLAERSSEEGVSLLRIRKLPQAFSFQTFSERLSVTWTYKEEGKLGAPTDDEMARMQRFEIWVAERVEGRTTALLALVFTQPRFRQFEYYCRSKEEFLRLLNRLPDNDEEHSITITHESDPSGRFYNSYAKALPGAA